MTENLDEICRSLDRKWQYSILLLFVFYLLHQVWKWLYERQDEVNKDGRVEIMKLLRNLVYAHDAEEYERAYKSF